MSTPSEFTVKLGDCAKCSTRTYCADLGALTLICGRCADRASDAVLEDHRRRWSKDPARVGADAKGVQR